LVNGSLPLDRWWFTVNGTVTNISAAVNGSNSLLWKTNGVGNWSLFGFVNDTMGNSNQSIEKWVVVYPSVRPNVSLYSPADGSNVSAGVVVFNVSCSASGMLANISLYLNVSGWSIVDTVGNSTFWPVAGMPYYINYTLGAGDYLWNALCYDSMGDGDWGDNNFTLFVTTTTSTTTSTTSTSTSTTTTTLPGSQVCSAEDPPGSGGWNVSVNNVCNVSDINVNGTLTVGDGITFTLDSITMNVTGQLLQLQDGAIRLNNAVLRV
jgi:hypothetical protein